MYTNITILAYIIMHGLLSQQSNVHSICSVQLTARTNARRVCSWGIYENAKVVRGKHWRYLDQDKGNNGVHYEHFLLTIICSEYIRAGDSRLVTRLESRLELRFGDLRLDSRLAAKDSRLDSDSDP